MRNSLALLALLALHASAVPTLEPPPGWTDINHAGKATNNVIALKGPQTSSFFVKRAASAPLDNAAGVRGFLREVLAGVRDGSKLDYRTSGRVETRVFPKNGLSAQMLLAQLNGEDKLVIALFADGAVPHLAVLTSAAPEAMLPSLLGSIQTGRIEGAVQTGGVARSLDGQLEIDLGGGRRSRALLDTESIKGFVLVIQGAGSEVLFQKLSESEATKPSEQAAIVRELVSATSGVAADKASEVLPAPTAAGPVAVYSWAPTKGNDKIAVGYLPWGYWGYQLFGRGPSADELMANTLAALKAGPSSVPGLLASTPKIPIRKALISRNALLGGAAAVALLGAVFLIGWSLKRKNANVPS